MEVKDVVGGFHTKRTKGFLSACIAYAFITIPSLDSYYVQLQLYLLTSQVAYANQCVSQGMCTVLMEYNQLSSNRLHIFTTGDACLKAAINLLNESKTEIEHQEHLLLEYVSNLVKDHVCRCTLLKKLSKPFICLTRVF